MFGEQRFPSDPHVEINYLYARNWVARRFLYYRVSSKRCLILRTVWTVRKRDRLAVGMCNPHSFHLAGRDTASARGPSLQPTIGLQYFPRIVMIPSDPML